MALTKISTGGVNDDAIDKAQIENEAVDAPRLHVSNAGSSGQFLQKQAGSTGGLAWATVDSTPEGTAIKSTGESGANKFLRTDGDGTSSWSTLPTTTAHNLTVVDESSDQNCFPLFVASGATGTKAPFTGTNLGFNSSTGVLSATKFSGDGSTLTNLPPAGNTVELQADGAIAAGKPVVVTTAGKAEQVKESYAALSTPTYNTINESANMPNAYSPIPLYSASADTYAFLYRDGDYSKIVCGQLNSSSQWSFGSPSGNISADSDYSQHASMAIVPASEVSGASNDVLVVVYRDYPGNNDGWMRLGTVNNNKTISLNSGHDDITGGDMFRSFMRAMGNGKVILGYSNGSEVKVIALDITGSNAFSSGSESTALSGGCGNANPVYISEPDSNGKAIIMAINNSSELVAQSISVSGTTITLGTEVELTSYAIGSLRDPKIAYNKDDDNFLAVFTNNALQCVAMTISGTTITKSAVTPIQVSSSNIETRGIGVVYDSRLKHFWVHVSRDGNNNDDTNYYFPVTETAATTPTIGTAKTTSFSKLIDALNCVYVESDNVVVSIGRNTSSTNDIFTIAAKLGSTSSNFTANKRNFIGFAEDAISDTNTGTIKLRGNVVGSQSGLTPGLRYKTNNDGTLTNDWGSDHVGLLAIASDKGIVIQNNGM